MDVWKILLFVAWWFSDLPAYDLESIQGIVTLSKDVFVAILCTSFLWPFMVRGEESATPS